MAPFSQELEPPQNPGRFSVTESAFCSAFSKAVAEEFSSGDLDADGASFAMDDLHHASGYALSGIALAVFDALEYRESSPADIRELLDREAAKHAAQQFYQADR